MTLMSPLHGQCFYSISLTNHKATKRLAIFYAAPRLVKRAEALAKDCSCRGAVRRPIAKILKFFVIDSSVLKFGMLI